MNLQHVRSDAPDPHRHYLYQRAIWVALVGNFLLAGGKGVVAWISGSSAIFSDAANSLSDALYSLLMGLGLYMSQQPPDENHPQGHSRFEPFVGLFIGLTMTSAGIAALWQSVDRFISGAREIDPGWPTTVLLISALVKLGMYLYVNKIGQKAHSPAIRASAKDNLADILTSTAALIGVWLSGMVHPILDPVAGVLVALWIFRAAWGIVSENLAYLTGKGASPELLEHIAEVSYEVEGVQDVHRVVADYVGPGLRMDMHINVDGQVPLETAHDIAEKVRERVEALIEVDLVFIHVEPTPEGDHSAGKR